MMTVKLGQQRAFVRAIDRVAREKLTAEISLIRDHVEGVDLTTPPDEVIDWAQRTSEQYGLMFASDLRNLVVAFLFREHSSIKQRHDLLLNSFAFLQFSASALCPHLLALHASCLERDYDWRKECR